MVADFLPTLIGRGVKDENGREIGKIVSFIIDSSGEVKEVLIENKNDEFVRYPVARIKASQDEIFLVSDIERRADRICESLPILWRKREILESLFRNKEIPPEIYESLSAEFDKSLSELRTEAQNLLGDIERQIQFQEDTIRTLHLARTFLEMEHGIGNIKDEVFRQSLLSILREIKYASYRKMSLLKTKDRVISISLQTSGESMEVSGKKDLTIGDYVSQRPAINVRITGE